MNEDFKKSESLAQKVMDILITDYLNKDKLRIHDEDRSEIRMNNQEYLSLIKWSIEDYESCGYNMHMYRIYLNVLKEQKRKR
jgi:hypothetical protein